MKDIKRLIGVVICAVCFIGLYILSDHYAEEAIGKYAYEITENSDRMPTKGSLTIEDVSLEYQIQNYETAKNRQDLVISFVGDITYEDDQLERYFDEESGSFDFSRSFQYIRPYLEHSDYVIGNLEAVLAGPDPRYDEPFDKYGTSGFLYNSPESSAKTMKEAGISMLQIANEHSGDFGNDGLQSTMDYLENAGIQTIGVQRSSEDKNYKLITVGGITIGVVAYTNDLNMPLNDDDPLRINTLDGYNESKVAQLSQAVNDARKDGAAFVAVMVYSGDVLNTEPEANQTELFDACFDAGADLVIGRRPYALQPIELRTIDQGDGTTRTGAAIYSLGTFLGSESYNASGMDNDISAIFQVIIHINSDGKAVVSGIRLVPTYINYTEDDIFVLPACDVVKNPEQFTDIVDEAEMERINAACNTVVPGIMESLNQDVKNNNNIYTINF